VLSQQGGRFRYAAYTRQRSPVRYRVTHILQRIEARLLLGKVERTTQHSATVTSI